MQRLRVRFVLLSAVVLIPVAFLVYRAVRTTELEAAMQHQAIAERVFDEMERGLSRLLENEGSRPIDDYLTAAQPSLPFVTGHFEVEPGGRIEVAATAPTDGNEQARRDKQADVPPQVGAELEATLSSYWKSAPAKKEPRAVGQMPGTTLAFGDRGATVATDDKVRQAPAEAEVGSTLQVLRSLNKGIAERAERPVAQDLDAVGRERNAALGAAADEMRPNAPESAMIARSIAEAEMMPTVGRLLDSQQLLLVRTVVRDRQTYRQGAVIDVHGLGRWLEEASLGGNRLGSSASVAFSTVPRDAEWQKESASGLYAYQHRFAEPFDDISAQLVLASLGGTGYLAYVYSLSALLLTAVVAGLAAIYRMVAVVVGYAERRSNFVAAVSHELKTPLTAIRMYGEMLRDGIVPSEAKRAEYYRHITAESERLSRLIDNVLEFSRLEKGNRTVHLVSGAVAPVVREAAELLRPHLEGAGFRLVVDCDEQVAPVEHDRDAFIQVLCNLGDNAVKYAAGSMRRDVELRCRQDKDAVVISVRDYGPGVPPRHLDKIFEPFYRREDELTRRTKGTGLGLALVRGLCERMGAQVVGRNAEGGGFEVEVRFDLSS
jgi:signal transduction histidine kinase